MPERSVIGRIISLGLCSFLAQISLVAAMAAINNMLRRYGAADPMFGLALLLPRFFGPDGVLYSMPAADILTAAISAIIILKPLRRLQAASARN